MRLRGGLPYFAAIERVHRRLYVAHQLSEDALDLIWWDHITELCKERDDLDKDIREKNRDLAQSPDGDFKKNLSDEKAALESKLTAVRQKLTDLNYGSETMPNLHDQALMEVTRRARNSATYESWKKDAELVILTSRGQKQIPWP